MKINKEELIKKLQIVKPGLSNKEIIEFSNSFAFSNGYVVTYNDFISIKCPIGLDLSGTILADVFYKAIDLIKPDKDGEIDLSIKEGIVIIKSGKSSAGIPINESGKLPIQEIDKKITKWEGLPEGFIEGIKLSSFSISNDASKPILTCLHLKGSMIEANNGERGFRYFMESEIKDEFLLPGVCIQAICNHPITHYNLDTGWIHFKTKEKVIISSRMYQETEFPDTSDLFSVAGKKFKFPAALKETIDRANIFTTEDINSETINIQVDNNGLTISSESVNGWFKETVPLKSPNNIRFTINPKFLKDILTKNMIGILDTKTNIMKFKSGNWEYIILVFIPEQ